MLRTTPPHGLGRWRIVNQRRTDGDAYVDPALHDNRRRRPTARSSRSAATFASTAALQQRMLQAQQSMERDYLRLRQAESRYRLLFDVSAEPVLIIDAATNRFVEVNPAARRLIGNDAATVAGAPFVAVFEAGSRDRAGALLAAAAARVDDRRGRGSPRPDRSRLPACRRLCSDRISQHLCPRPADADHAGRSRRPRRRPPVARSTSSTGCPTPLS